MGRCDLSFWSHAFLFCDQLLWVSKKSLAKKSDFQKWGKYVFIHSHDVSSWWRLEFQAQWDFESRKIDVCIDWRSFTYAEKNWIRDRLRIFWLLRTWVWALLKAQKYTTSQNKVWNAGVSIVKSPPPTMKVLAVDSWWLVQSQHQRRSAVQRTVCVTFPQKSLYILWKSLVWVP